MTVTAADTTRRVRLSDGNTVRVDVARHDIRDCAGCTTPIRRHQRFTATLDDGERRCRHACDQCQGIRV
jgi:hypothetical protein